MVVVVVILRSEGTRAPNVSTEILAIIRNNSTVEIFEIFNVSRIGPRFSFLKFKSCN